MAANPVLRQRILEPRASHDQVIDEVSVDVLLDVRGVVDVERARSVVTSWRSYLDEHRDEITAVQVVYSEPRSRSITFSDLSELAERIHRPPYDFVVTTANQQLNFVQHIATILDINSLRWSYRTTRSSRAASGRRFGAGCWPTSTCTRCCGCRRASSTPRA